MPLMSVSVFYLHRTVLSGVLEQRHVRCRVNYDGLSIANEHRSDLAKTQQDRDKLIKNNH